MSTNCAPLVADLFMLCYERDFMMSLSDDKQAGVIDAFNTTSSIGATIEFLTSLPVKDGGPHDFRSKMAAPTTPRWRPPRNQDGGPCDAFGYTSEGESTP